MRNAGAKSHGSIFGVRRSGAAYCRNRTAQAGLGRATCEPKRVHGTSTPWHLDPGCTITSLRAIPKPVYADLGDSLRLAGYHHFCLTVATMEAAIEELRKRGVTVVTEPFYLEAINRKLAFISDPFGNLIELAEPVA